MNRQQRRKAERRGTFVDTETGMAAHGLGTVHEVRIKADLPAKVEGVHRWIASVAVNDRRERLRAIERLDTKPEATAIMRAGRRVAR